MVRAATVVCQAVDLVTKDWLQHKGKMTTVTPFCCVRPPGHHVGRNGMAGGCCSNGFCLLNNVGIGALHARLRWGVRRVAVVDFDVHFGNGTLST